MALDVPARHTRKREAADECGVAQP